MSDTPTFFGGDIPRNYDEGLGPHIFVDYAAMLAERVSLDNPGNVLELAAGTGIVTRKLRDFLPTDCKLLATDLSPLMLDVAAEKFSSGDEVEFQDVDAMDLPFEDETFDLIVCQFGVMFFPDKVESFKEARRVLTPEGIYHFNVWDSFDENPFARVIQETVERLIPDDPPQFYRMPFSYADPALIQADLEAAGFEDITFEEVSLHKDIDYERLMQGIVHGNPMMTELEDRGADVDGLTAAIEEALKAEFGDPGAMPLKAIFVRAA
jgi:ubiquinone/menaquinone biosynthesis C-methylase UbiE